MKGKKSVLLFTVAVFSKNNQSKKLEISLATYDKTSKFICFLRRVANSK
jgi:hypothetical protein